MDKVTRLTAGIDTAKDKLDVAVHGVPARLSVPNDKHGWKQIASDLRRHGVNWVGIEPTGGYERGVTEHLRTAGWTVLVMQPARVKAYARHLGLRAKNDRIDARLIAAAAHVLDAPSVEPDPRFAALADHLTYIEQVEEDIVRAKTRAEHIRLAWLRVRSANDINRLRKIRREELQRLGQALRAEPDLAQRLALVLSVPGIGERTAIAIIVRMPELGQISREEAAALAGLAPFDDDSGKHHGIRHIAGGRDRLRHSLYAAALPAAFRWNKALMVMYARLVKAGKKHKVALIACARKLLVYANTVVARGTPWLAAPAA